jgi:integrase
LSKIARKQALTGKMVPGAGFEPATSGQLGVCPVVLQIMSLALADPKTMEAKHYQAVLPRHTMESIPDSYPRQQIIKLEHPKEFFEGLLLGKVSGSIPNQDTIFLGAFREYLHGKVNDKVAYEYERIAKHFLEHMYGEMFDPANPHFRDKLKEFLDIENPNSYRNTLACLRHLFAFLHSEEFLEGYKFKAVMPSFSIATPSLEDVRKFAKELRNKTLKFYFELGIISGIRPEHLLKLYKSLFDTQNNMINTFQKTFGKKNFFFSFYTKEMKAEIEAYLKTLPKPDSLLFPIGTRYIQKEYVEASKRSGVKITPKTARKFFTNWCRRHGMIQEDVDVLTGHTPHSIVAKHYIDTSRIHEEYDRAMESLKLRD